MSVAALPLPSRPSGAPRRRALTAREEEVAFLLRRHLLLKEIAHRLGISPHTVDAHLRSISSKLGISSRDELYDRRRFPESRQTLERCRHLLEPQASA